MVHVQGGTHTEDSDIDIGIYYNSESFDINTINQFATKLDDEHRNNLVVPPGAWGDWINGGGWLVINGYHVDLILRDIKRVEQIMKDTEHGIVPLPIIRLGIPMVILVQCIEEN